jgi:hypothetical protein
MSEPLQFTNEHGMWNVSLSLNVPPHGAFSEAERNALEGRCSGACVQPVKATYFGLRAGDSCTLEMVTLDAYFDSEEKARSAETEEAFRHSIENVRNVLMQRPVCAM